MPTQLLWKFALIVVIVGAAAFFIYPPEERIALGLDLSGGSHIVMQVETESAIEYEMGLAQSRLGQRLKSMGLTYESILAPETTVLELRGTDPAKRADVRKALDDQFGRSWEVRDLGSGTWRATMPPTVRQSVANTAVNTTLDTIRNRIDGLGVREPTVQKQGIRGDRILVQLPGVEDPERAKDLLQEPSLLEWKKVTYPPGVRDFEGWYAPASRRELLDMFGGQLPDDTEMYPQHTTAKDGSPLTLWWPLKRVSDVVGTDLVDAWRDRDQWNNPVVRFQLTQDAGKRFEVATREYEKKKMAIVLGGASKDSKNVLPVPVIEDVIRDEGHIRGSYTIQSAEDFALKLRSGAMPTDVTIIEERTVGPSLGRDSIRAGVIAALVGFAAVLVFMVVYYRLSGVNAVVALALNVVLVLGAMGYFGATLTLPGIAGLILTVGMAVDSNVLIFERIREELRIGKTVRSAVDQGFSRAFMTILDCNVTTLVAAFFLFSYGTGPVKGFAVTLTIGLLSSMFTAVFVSRQLFEIVLGRHRRVESLSI